MDLEISQQPGLQPATATTTTTNWVGVSFSTTLALLASSSKKLEDPTEPWEINAGAEENRAWNHSFWASETHRLWNQQANLNAYTTQEIPKTEENKSKRPTFSITARFVAPENQEMFKWKLLDTRKEVALVNKETPGRKNERTSWNDRIFWEVKRVKQKPRNFFSKLRFLSFRNTNQRVKKGNSKEGLRGFDLRTQKCRARRSMFSQKVPTKSPFGFQQ